MTIGQHIRQGGRVAEFKAFDPEVEVLGDVVLSFVHAMGAFKGLAVDILQRHGIESPKSHRWYPQQAWLDAFATIAEEIGPATLIQIGRQIPQQGRYRPGLDNIETARDLERVASGFASEQILDELNIKGWGSLDTDDGQLCSLRAKANGATRSRRLRSGHR